LASVAAAEPINQLGAAFDSIRADLHDAHAVRSHYQPAGYLYPFLVLTIAGFISLGLMTFVIPQFKNVMEEMMEVQALPKSTTLLIGIGQWLCYETDGAPIVILLILGLLAWPLHFRPRRPQRPYLMTRLGDWIRWWLPGFRWFERTRSQLRTTEHLRLALNAAIPINEAIGQAAGHDINGCYRRRLQKWKRRVEAGGNPAQTAKQSRIGRALAWAFNQDLHTGATPDILAVLETHYRLVYRYRLQVSQYILIPTTILCVAAMVGFIAFALYSPAIQIINNMVALYP
jgi:type II secretory pathway component PulF